MLSYDAMELLKERLKSGPKDACVFQDTAWFCGCQNYKDPNCILIDRRECPFLDAKDAEALRNEI